jgi:hypothetical protein
MSDIPSDWREQLDLRAIVQRFDRDRADMLKLQEEREKLIAERRKYNRDPWLLALTAMIAFLAAVASRLPEILHAFGVG